MNERGIWHSLAYGTLLGAVREGDVIEWDHDFDLFVRPGDAQRILELNSVLSGVGVEIGRLRYPSSMLAVNPGGVGWFDPMHLQVRSDGVPIGDCFMPSVFADGVLRRFDFATDVYWTPHFSIPHFYFEEMTQAHIGEHAYPVPVHAEDFLALMYGSDWRVPYRSVIDGGNARSGVTDHSHRFAPSLRQSTAWAASRGCDFEMYVGQPSWPRRVAGAGPIGPTPRTTRTSRALWWHDIDELVEHF
jgi:hypothetical protein